MKLDQISKRLYRWSEKHGQLGSEYEWHSYALRVASDVFLVLDPLPPSSEVMAALQSHGPPSHILLSCVWHSRAAESLRSRWGCKVLLNEKGVADSEIGLDETFRLPCRLWETINLFPLVGLSWPEEVAVYFDEHLLIMDALAGGRADLGIPNGEVGIHPNRFSMGHITDFERARRLILHLADLPLKEIHFGHGSPVRLDPSACLKKLASEQFWSLKSSGMPRMK